MESIQQPLPMMLYYTIRLSR